MSVHVCRLVPQPVENTWRDKLCHKKKVGYPPTLYIFPTKKNITGGKIALHQEPWFLHDSTEALNHSTSRKFGFLPASAKHPFSPFQRPAGLPEDTDEFCTSTLPRIYVYEIITNICTIKMLNCQYHHNHIFSDIAICK